MTSEAKNAHNDIEGKQIQPTVDNWGGGDIVYHYRGDGYELVEKTRPGSLNFICFDDTE